MFYLKAYSLTTTVFFTRYMHECSTHNSLPRFNMLRIFLLRKSSVIRWAISIQICFSYFNLEYILSFSSLKAEGSSERVILVLSFPQMVDDSVPYSGSPAVTRYKPTKGTFGFTCSRIFSEIAPSTLSKMNQSLVDT